MTKYISDRGKLFFICSETSVKSRSMNYEILSFSNLMIFAFAGSAFVFRSINFVIIYFGLMIASIRFFYFLANKKN